MKKFMTRNWIIGFLFIVVSVAMAATFTDDLLKIGKPGSSADKKIVVDTGDGASNPAITIDMTNKDFDFNKAVNIAGALLATGNTTTLGDGTAVNKQIIFDKGLGASNPRFRWNETNDVLEFSNDGTTFRQIGSGSGGGGGVNLFTLFNADFETGSPPQNYTASGGTFVAETTNPMFGDQSGKWDSNASSQTLASDAVQIEQGFIGRRCSGDLYYRWPSGVAADLKFQILDTGVVVSEVELSPTTGSNVAVAQPPAFDCPDTTTDTLQWRLLSTVSDPAEITIDNAFVGVDKITSQLSQANMVASGKFASTASCTWARTNTAQGAFGTTAACPGPTVEFNPGPGILQTTDADLPQFTINNLPAGRYLVHFVGQHSLSVSAFAALSIFDGTTRSGQAGTQNDTSSGHFHLTGQFVYSDSGNRTFQLQGGSSTGTVTLQLATANTNDIYFYVEKLPVAPAEALTLDTSAASWSGYHDVTCTGWTRTNVAFGAFAADASCALVEQTNSNFGTVSTSGSVLPAITFTPKRIGKYYFNVLVNEVRCGSAGGEYAIRLTDGTTVWAENAFECANGGASGSPMNLQGIVNITSLSPITLSIEGKGSLNAIVINANGTVNALYWAIYAIDQQFPAPIFTEITQLSNNALRVNSATAAKLPVIKMASINCIASPVTTSDPFGHVGSITRDGTGSCTVNWATPFPNAVAGCSCQLRNSVSNTFCLSASAGVTTSGFRVDGSLDGGGAVDREWMVQCTGW